MREEYYIRRVNELEKALTHNTKVYGQQLARVVARTAAIEEVFLQGPEDAGYFRSRWLLFRNRLLSFLAPGRIGRILTEREDAIMTSMRTLAEERIIDDAVKEMPQAKQPTPNSVESEAIK